uniref:Uncharacterized protein n=1 Tax=Eutreptiella gymnastica TaxID=73025 RepID=A0A7S1JCW6_9EUGL|mmetsp:Transcript_86266/g.150353  ORF Transcript_86266/g.150353 Transcript_86266/m.150353 type:complete len:111 (+) Transcript_86266:11-343(+)
MALPLGGGALGAGAQAQDEKSRTGTRRQMLAGSSGSVVDASKGRGHLNETAGPPVGGAVGGLDRTQGQMPVPGTCRLTQAGLGGGSEFKPVSVQLKEAAAATANQHSAEA